MLRSTSDSSQRSKQEIAHDEELIPMSSYRDQRVAETSRPYLSFVGGTSFSAVLLNEQSSDQVGPGELFNISDSKVTSQMLVPREYTRNSG
ncbi:Hypothetical predicted protein [Octopus vulgaris]|uniref:Uncharacterized protein n=1 Tax=Octopus vulgaris TaxID=6645 RepID=A0AA36EX23_OCTVU|nr:Hypothetical predicted protein [Octopus vulgaris]